MSGPLVLAIESATACVGCSLGTPEGVIASTYSARGRRHAESLAPQIAFIAEQAGVSIGDIEVIAVDVGPGLYTGLRVGITTGRAMAHTLDVPMVAVSSLDALAHAHRAGGDMIVAVDARRREVFHAAYTVGTDGCVSGGEPGVGPADAAVVAGHTRVVGDGAIAYADTFAAAGLAIVRDGPHPMPDAVLELAVQRLDAVVAPVAVQPLYLRRPDAVAKWDGGGR